MPVEHIYLVLRCSIHVEDSLVQQQQEHQREHTEDRQQIVVVQQHGVEDGEIHTNIQQYENEAREAEEEDENSRQQEGGVGGEEEDEHEIKLVYQTSLEKPLQSGILKGLNRLDGFACVHCPRVLATKYSLMIHTRIHTGEKPHPCTVCPSKFMHPTDLRRHMLKHTGEKPFKCDVCGAGFTQTTSLKGHSRQHPGPKPHKLVMFSIDLFHLVCWKNSIL